MFTSIRHKGFSRKRTRDDFRYTHSPVDRSMVNASAAVRVVCDGADCAIAIAESSVAAAIVRLQNVIGKPPRIRGARSVPAQPRFSSPARSASGLATCPPLS